MPILILIPLAIAAFGTVAVAIGAALSSDDPDCRPARYHDLDPRKKTEPVSGYARQDGTPVRGYYRRPRR